MSSLIEQAARRLEELRRAGVEVPDEARSASTIAHDANPTPEAVVLALDERAHASASVHERRAGRSPSGRGETQESTARHVDIDFGRLRKMGFVTPDSGASQIAEEFRVIKRPIIRNAMGRGTRVRNGNLVMV